MMSSSGGVKLGGSGKPTYETAAFASLFVESILYGAFALTYFISIYVLFLKRSVRNSWTSVNAPLFLVSSLMFLFSTVHLIINFHRDYQAFVDSPDPQKWLIQSGTKTPEYITKNVLYNAQTILGDGFIMYRLYVVWDHRRLICLPFFLCFLASIGTAVGTLVQQTLIDPSKASTLSAGYRELPLSFFALTLVTNMGCSLLIAARIWITNWRARHVQSSSLLPVATLVVESGSVYAASVLIVFVLYFCNSGAMKIVMDALMQLIGIVFCGIIVSVSLGLWRSGGEGSSTVGPSSIRFDTIADMNAAHMVDAEVRSTQTSTASMTEKDEVANIGRVC